MAKFRWSERDDYDLREMEKKIYLLFLGFNSFIYTRYWDHV